MKRILFMAIAMLVATAMNAQKFSIKGMILDNDTQEAIPSATVQVLTAADSTFVAGSATDMSGNFTIKDLSKGKYIIKVSYIGYITTTQNLELSISKSKKETDLGFITIKSDNVLLAETQVTANASKVKVSGDSIIFNASAFRTPAGSTLEALVKKLPGAKVDESGKITINGKEVTKIMVNGKEFFLNDTETAMKNIPVDIVDNIKTYDKKSDLARVTGIDDGEDETVLDLSVKKGMMKGWIGNLNGGAGTKDRYSARANIMRITEVSQFTLLGGLNNVNDMGFGGGGGRGWGRGGSGLTTSKNVGFNFATTSDKLETGGSIRYNYRGNDTRSRNSQQSFVTKSGAFSESLSQSYSSNHNLNTQFRIEWKPDTMTNIMFRPSYTYSNNNGYSYSQSASYNKDPNLYTEEPLDSITALINRIDSIVVNTNNSRQQTHSTSNSFNGMLQANRKLNDDGRNITLRVNGSYTDSESKQISAANVQYYMINRTPDINNRYYVTPNKNYSMNGQLTYSEPIAYKTYLQLSYQANYNYSDNSRDAFTYSSPTLLEAYTELDQALRNHRYDIEAIVNYMRERNMAERRTDSLCQETEYKTFQQTVGLSFRRVTDRSNFSLGVDLVPIYTQLHYLYKATEYDIDQHQFNFAPRVQYRFNPNKMTNLNIRYNGRMSQPSLTNLLDIKDDMDPLNITRGNPDLKPSFSHSMNLDYHTYNEDSQASFFSFINGGFTQNNISSITRYHEDTGVRETTSTNVNGNWNAFGGFGFNTPIDPKNKYFTVDAFTNLSFNNRVGYVQQGTDNIKSNTQTLSVGQSASFSYRRELIEISLNGNVDFSHNRNDVTDANNQDTWDFSYGAEFQYTTSFGLTLNTDIGMNSRRGYSSDDMNTNELIWNAQLSQTFLNGSLSVILEVNDILAQQSNISRTITEIMRSDTRTNSIYQYGMLRVSYRFNAFGGNNPFNRRRGNGGMGGFGGGMGGFGGGFGGPGMF